MKRKSNSGALATEEKEEDEYFPKREDRGRPKSEIYPSSRQIFVLCLIFRMANSLLVQTYFNPDEHWQALEVAHRITFGYGHLTWEWSKGIRSYLHPMVFVLLYKFLAFFGLDTPWFMVRAPRLLQSILSSIGDFYLYKLAYRMFGERVAQWTLFSQLTNWFTFFCFTRTFSNNVETVLTLIGLYYWPSFGGSSGHSSKVSRKWGLFVAALACAIRPTSAITWLYVGLLELFQARDRLKFIFLEVVPIGSLVLAFTSLLDRFMYGSWIIVPLNFLKFNFLSSGGDYYGTHKWHWYFSQGFTVMVFTFLPFSIAGIFQSKQWKLFGLMVWVLGLYSVLGHKEFRFVLPVLPVALMFSGYALAAMETPGSKSHKRKISSDLRPKCPSRMKFSIFFLLATNLPMGLYMSLVHQILIFHVILRKGPSPTQHNVLGKKLFLPRYLSILTCNRARQRGSEDAMNFLGREALGDKVRSILFLMPCHNTPYYSTLHRNLPMRFLDCSPSENRSVPDESDRFMMDPVGFVQDMVKDWSLPSHIVLFDSEERKLKDFLTSHSFIEVKRFFHAHIKVDRELQASVVIYALADK